MKSAVTRLHLASPITKTTFAAPPREQLLEAPGLRSWYHGGFERAGEDPLRLHNMSSYHTNEAATSAQNFRVSGIVKLVQ